MKRTWQHPEEPASPATLTPEGGETPAGKHYWRSLSELAETRENIDARDSEFHGSPGKSEESESSRRDFMKLMGASTALAGGLAACRKPTLLLVPYSESVEWIIPGKALLYATAMPRLGGCTPLVVTTHEGRPTHVSGNRLHPEVGNGNDGIAQSSILDLYDPERSRNVLNKGERSSQADFSAAFAEIAAGIKKSNGEGSAFLVGETSSPTRDRLLKEVATKFPQAVFYRYESINRDAVRKGLSDATDGKTDVSIVPRFEKAKRILSLDCDFLGLDSPSTNATNAFSKNRKVDDGGAAKMNRLYVVEASYTVTGGMADHRLPTNASQVATIAAALGKTFGLSVESTTKLDEKTTKWVAATAKDLQAHKGEALVVAGSQQPAAVHAMVAAINDKLGAFGKTADLLNRGNDPVPFGTLGELAEAIGEKKVKTLFLTTEADPAYDAPGDIDFARFLGEVETTIQLSTRSLSATARAATWHVPAAHYLESWGDVRSAEGVYSIVQPMILPLYDGLTEIDFLLKLMADPAPATDPAEGETVVSDSEATPGYEAVRATFAEIAEGDIEKAWNATLRDGFLKGSSYKASNAKIALPSGKGGFPAPTLDAMEIAFRPDFKIWDGRYINNGWAQEAPDPTTSLTWDNAALLSIRTAKALGIENNGQMLKVEVAGKTAYYPAMLAPGHADNSLTIPFGYGQGEDAGFIGSDRGFNAHPVRTFASPYLTMGAKVSVLTADEIIDGEKVIPANYDLATTAEHNNMYGRALVREGTVDAFEKKPDFAKKQGMDAHIPENVSFYKSVDQDDKPLLSDPHHQWGMTIDLNQCIGCTACLLACQSENNIPIVGKEQVMQHREMHWIRMDRYFATAEPKLDKKTQDAGANHEWTEMSADHFENPEMTFQPVACQQCESAPCETVCPVNATVHTEDGLNSMAYNRCIGTRYCANNCPYKARRFNYFDYNKRPIDELYRGPFSTKEKTGVAETHKLQKNPNVTVRMRGVMEKCTYCVQRIQEGKIEQKRIARDSDKLRVATGAVRTACQDVCSADAITFGNLLDDKDPLVKMKASPRNYDLLNYIGTLPRTSYLARIKNPNAEIVALTGKAIGEISSHIH